MWEGEYVNEYKLLYVYSSGSVGGGCFFFPLLIQLTVVDVDVVVVVFQWYSFYCFSPPVTTTTTTSYMYYAFVTHTPVDPPFPPPPPSPPPPILPHSHRFIQILTFLSFTTPPSQSAAPTLLLPLHPPQIPTSPHHHTIHISIYLSFTKNCSFDVFFLCLLFSFSALFLFSFLFLFVC